MSFLFLVRDPDERDFGLEDDFDRERDFRDVFLDDDVFCDLIDDDFGSDEDRDFIRFEDGLSDELFEV